MVNSFASRACKVEFSVDIALRLMVCHNIEEWGRERERERQKKKKRGGEKRSTAIRIKTLGRRDKLRQREGERQKRGR